MVGTCNIGRSTILVSKAPRMFNVRYNQLTVIEDDSCVCVGTPEHIFVWQQSQHMSQQRCHSNSPLMLMSHRELMSTVLQYTKVHLNDKKK